MHTFLIRSCVDIGVLDDHVITATLVVVADHKLTPVLHRQIQETLNHLWKRERGKKKLGEKLGQNTKVKRYTFAQPRPQSRSLTLGCRFVSCRMVIGSGSGTAWPTIVGPNTRARLVMSILVSLLWATLHMMEIILKYNSLIIWK